MKAESVSNLGDDTTGTTLVAVHSPPIAMIGNTEYPGKSCNLNPGLKIQGTQIRTDNSNQKNMCMTASLKDNAVTIEWIPATAHTQVKQCVGAFIGASSAPNTGRSKGHNIELGTSTTNMCLITESNMFANVLDTPCREECGMK